MFVILFLVPVIPTYKFYVYIESIGTTQYRYIYATIYMYTYTTPNKLTKREQIIAQFSLNFKSGMAEVRIYYVLYVLQEYQRSHNCYDTLSQ